MDGNQKISNDDIFTEFLSPPLLRHKLIMYSMYIAVYENFKCDIIDKVKHMYWSGYEDGKEIFENYEKEVLSKVESKKNRQIRATLKWLNTHGAITENDIELFKQQTDIRNSLAHELPNKLYEKFSDEIYDIYISMINLYDKIIKWWIYEIELPTTSEYTVEQYENIDYDGLTSVNLQFIRIIADIALGENEEYLQMYKKAQNK